MKWDKVSSLFVLSYIIPTFYAKDTIDNKEKEQTLLYQRMLNEKMNPSPISTQSSNESPFSSHSVSLPNKPSYNHYLTNKQKVPTMRPTKIIDNTTNTPIGVTIQQPIPSIFFILFVILDSIISIPSFDLHPIFGG